MKIAIASSGLGHIARGIETWALDTANALNRQGADVTLFAAGNVDSEAPLIVLPCLRRRTPKSDFIIKLMPSFTWRWGLKSGYGLEQLTFWKNLKPQLNAGNYDILHIQDPMIADLCRKAREKGQIRTKEILAHGTEEPLEFLAKFSYLQHLAPWHLEKTKEKREKVEKLKTGNTKCSGEIASRQTATGERSIHQASYGVPGGHECGIQSRSYTSHIPNDQSPNDQTPMTNSQSTNDQYPNTHPHWTAMPNFINTELYRPVKNRDEKQAIRSKLGIPQNALVIGTAAAIKKHHKRIDYLIREFAAFVKSSSFIVHRSSFLIIAGSQQPDTEDLQNLAEKLCPGKTKFLINHPHEQMPDLLRSYDIFVLTSLFEMMPIALLEAIATGLPVITNNHPVLEWMGGPGGLRPDMSQPGALAKTLANISAGQIEQLGCAARQHALNNYSEDTVIQQYQDYYGEIWTL